MLGVGVLVHVKERSTKITYRLFKVAEPTARSPQNLKAGSVAVVIRIATSCADSHSTTSINRLRTTCGITKRCYHC